MRINGIVVRMDTSHCWSPGLHSWICDQMWIKLALISVVNAFSLSSSIHNSPQKPYSQFNLTRKQWRISELPCSYAISKIQFYFDYFEACFHLIRHIFRMEGLFFWRSWEKIRVKYRKNWMWIKLKETLDIDVHIHV